MSASRLDAARVSPPRVTAARVTARLSADCQSGFRWVTVPGADACFRWRHIPCRGIAQNKKVGRHAFGAGAAQPIPMPLAVGWGAIFLSRHQALSRLGLYWPVTCADFLRVVRWRSASSPQTQWCFVPTGCSEQSAVHQFGVCRWPFWGCRVCDVGIPGSACGVGNMCVRYPR